MPVNIAELKRQKMEIVTRGREVHDLATKEGRKLTQEEQNNYQQMVADARSLQETIQREEELQELAGGDSARFKTMTGEFDEQGEGMVTHVYDTPEYARSWSKYIRDGYGGMTPMEIRALSSTNSEGGYMMTPKRVADGVIVAINNRLFIRQAATKFQLEPGTKSLGVPTIATDIEDATVTAEVTGADEDTALAFGERELTPIQYTKYIKVSNKLLRGVPNVEQIVIDRMAYKFGVTLEKEYMTGDGDGSALGIFTADATGIPTGSDVRAADDTTVVVDDFVKTKYKLPAQYWQRAAWVMHPDVAFLVAVQREGSGTGNYLWRESVRAGEPDTLLGRPVWMSAYAPNTMTADQYVAVLGDFSFYHIADSLAFTVKRLDELYAITNQTGFIGRFESDAMPVLGDAFRRVQLAAS